MQKGRPLTGSPFFMVRYFVADDDVWRGSPRPVFDAALSRSKQFIVNWRNARGAKAVTSTGVTAPERESGLHGIGVESLTAWRKP